MTRRKVLLLLQVAVTVALLLMLFRGLDWSAFADSLGRVSPWFFLGSFGVIVTGQLLYAWRWQVVLQGMGFDVRYREVIKQYLLGIFVGTLMPTAIGGDAAKVYYLGRRMGYVGITASVFVDRFLGFLWLSLLGATLAWTVGAPGAMLEANRSILTGLAAAFVGGLVVMRFVPIERLVPQAWRLGWLARSMERLSRFVGFVREGGCRFRTLAASGTVVLVYTVLLALVYQSYFTSNGYADAGFLQIFSLVLSMSVLVNAPVSVNGIGLREQLHFLLFAAIGLPKEVSVSLALLLFGYSLILSAAGYFVWLRVRPHVEATA